MNQSRRAFVTAALAVWSGCVGSEQPRAEGGRRSDDTTERTPSSVSDSPATPTCDRTPPSGSMDGTYTVAPGEFTAAIALTNSAQACGDGVSYEVTVRGDTPVDCLVFERDAWDAYVDGARDVSFVSRYSQTGVTDTAATHRLDRGQYIFAVDHTSVATTPGPEPVTVEVRVES